MPNKFYIWPTTKLAEAQAYKAECDIRWPGVGTGTWADIMEDAYGQWVVAALEPTFTYDFGDGNGMVPVPEPPECAALRVDAVLSDTWTPPDSGMG